MARLMDSIIVKINGGMGRPNKGIPPTTGKIFDSRVPMDKTGVYDKGGAYWGYKPNNPVRVRYTMDLSYIEFYREGEKTFPKQVN